MPTRKEFLKTMACLAAGAGLGLDAVASDNTPRNIFNINRGRGTRMRLRFFPYELQLRHVFTVATYSRSTTQIGRASCRERV